MPPTKLILHFFSAIAMLGATTAPAQGQNSCSATTIKGDYAFVSSVRRTIGNGPTSHTQRARVIGLISYDGNGSATVSGLTILGGGHTSSYADTGTYSVDGGHCTGSVKFQQNGDSKWDFVIVSGGSELLTVIEASADTTPFSQKKR
jgi:hypothetical protein